jgi:secondary thiamine-phosphate synthase enzyme
MKIRVFFHGCRLTGPGNREDMGSPLARHPDIFTCPDTFKCTPFSYLPMYQKNLQVTTAREGDIIDLTPEVRAAVRESGISEGMVNVFITGSTAAVTTIEYEPGVLSDLRKALSVLAPDTIRYAHDSRWGDGNGRSHVKASLVGPSLSVPVSGKEPLLGTWQQIVLLELDVRQGRTRTVVVSVTG